jgi:hypothetical protein
VKAAVGLVELVDVRVVGLHEHHGAEDVHEIHVPARPRQRREVVDDGLLAQPVVRQHVPHHHRVERTVRQSGRVGQPDLHGDVAPPAGRDQRLRLRHGRRHAVDADDPPVRAHRVGDRREHRPRSAADVGDGRAGHDAGELPQFGLGLTCSCSHDAVAGELGLAQL